MFRGYKYLFCSSCKKVFDAIPCRHYTRKGRYDTYSCPFCGKVVVLDVCPKISYEEGKEWQKESEK